MSTNTRGLSVSALSGHAATDILHSPTGRDLSQALRMLQPAERHALETRLGTAFFGELQSLAGERNPEIFSEGMLHLGCRLETHERFDAATAVYQGLASAPGVRERAQSRLQAIVGGGAAAPRAEFLLRHLSREVTRPEPLAAMAVAGLAFRVVRLGALSQILARPQSGWVTSTFGARWIAGSAGFLAEGTAFALAQKGFTQALGNSSDWSPAALGRDIASSLLVLGGLRLGGIVANTAYRRTLGLTGSAAAGPSLLNGLFQQSGMLGGIVLSHRLEEWAGLRSAAPFSPIDSLVTLLHFNLVGHLSRRVLGPGFHERELGLDLQAQRLTARGPSRPWTDLLGGSLIRVPELAGMSGGRRLRTGSASELGTGISFMVGDNGNGNGPRSRKAPENQTLPFSFRDPGMPLVFQTIHQAVRQLNEAERLRFPERLVQADTLIKIFEHVSEPSHQNFADVFLKFLNSIASRHPVPDGRLVELSIGNHPLINVVKFENQFQIENPAHPLPRIPAGTTAAPSPETARSPSSDHLKTLPFGAEGPGRDPLTSILSIELLRRIRDPEYHFDRYLREQDVLFTLQREDAFDADGFLRILTRELDKFPNIPLRRNVTLRLEPSQNQLVLVKTEEGFRPPGHVPAQLVSVERARLGVADTVIAQPADVAAIVPPTRPPPSAPSTSRTTTAPERKPLENATGVPILLRDLTQLPEKLHWALANRLDGEHPLPLILEMPLAADGSISSYPVTVEGLQAIAPRLAIEAPQPMFFDLAVPALRETFIAEVRGSDLHWRKGSNHLLNRSAIQVFSHRINAQNATALYQILEALARENPHRGDEQETTLHYADVYPRSALQNFREFIGQSLNGLGLRGRVIRVEFEKGEAPLVFEGRNGIWGLPEGELRVAGNQLELRNLINQLLDPQLGSSGMNIFLERRTVLTTPEIRRLEESLARLEGGRRLRIHDFKGRKTVTFERSGEALQVNNESWERPEDLEAFRGASLTRIVQNLSFLRGLVIPKPNLHVELQSPDSFEPQLPTFLEILNRWSWLPTSKFELSVNPAAEVWNFHKEIEGWQAERIR